MRATIDKAGRLVIPKQLRDEVGLRPGEVDVSAYGTGLRVEPVTGRSPSKSATAGSSSRLPASRSTTTSCAHSAMSARGSTPEFLVDTSVAVALSVADHEHHERTFTALGDRRLGLAGHAAFETFSVLTRLPTPARRAPATVARLLAGSFPRYEVPRCPGGGVSACQARNLGHRGWSCLRRARRGPAQRSTGSCSRLETSVRSRPTVRSTCASSS